MCLGGMYGLCIINFEREGGREEGMEGRAILFGRDE